MSIVPHVSLIPPRKLCSSWKWRLTWLVTSAAHWKAVEKTKTSQKYYMAEGWVAPDLGEIPARQKDCHPEAAQTKHRCSKGLWSHHPWGYQTWLNKAPRNQTQLRLLWGAWIYTPPSTDKTCRHLSGYCSTISPTQLERKKKGMYLLLKQHSHYKTKLGLVRWTVCTWAQMRPTFHKILAGSYYRSFSLSRSVLV